MNDDDILDRGYLTEEDFFNDVYIRIDDICREKLRDDLDIHFNKPGFDLAVIITDMCLIQSITDFQSVFQTKFGFTSHVIYLPDRSRLKFCIRDLKHHEIRYAIVVSEISQREDDYEAYILSDIIEHQLRMEYDLMLNWFKDDLDNYMEAVKDMLEKPGKSIHSNNALLGGAFIEPDNDIRYFLCLLLDYRMLEMDELLALRDFVTRRKAAIEQLGNVSINYGINSRPIPAYRKDKLKYYIYEYHGNKEETVEPAKKEECNDKVGSATCRNMEVTVSTTSATMIACTSTSEVPHQSAVSPVATVQTRITSESLAQPSVPVVTSPHISPVHNNPRFSIPGTSNHRNIIVQPLMDISLPNHGRMCPPVVAIPPQPQANIPTPMNFQGRVQHRPVGTPLARAAVNQRPVNMCSPQVSISPPRMPNGVVLVRSWIDKIAAVCQQVSPPQTQSQPVSTFSYSVPTATTPPTNTRSTPQSPISKNNQSLPVTISNPPSPATKITNNTITNTPLARYNVTQPSQSMSDVVQSWVDKFVLDTQDTFPPPEPEPSATSPISKTNRDSNPVVDYHLSPVSDDADDGANEQVAIDLTDDIPDAPATAPSPPKRMRHDPPQGAVINPDMSRSTPMDTTVGQKLSIDTTGCKVTCRTLKNFLKFAIVISPFSLSIQNGVMALMKKCLDDIERHIVYCGIKPITIDLRQCRSDGLPEVVKIIESLTGDTIGPAFVIADLKFMWIYYPQKLTDDSAILMFYKLIKLLDQCRLDSASHDILVAALLKIEQLATFNFQLTESRPQPPNIMNFFPSLFAEYFDLRSDLHNLALPTPEPISMTFNIDYDHEVMEHRIKFMVGPLLEFFILKINAIHYQLEPEKMEVVYWSMRSLRFCLRKISLRLLPESLPPLTIFSDDDTVMDRTIVILDEINYMLRDVTTLNCVLFTKKHYEFVNLILDFALKIDTVVTEGTDPDIELPEQDHLIHLDAGQFIQDFSGSIKTAVLPYHHDTEMDVFKRALKNRWIDTLHQAFKGVPPAPDGSRVDAELRYLVPKCWSRHTYNEAVQEAASLCFSDWDRMLTNDFAKARHTYNDVRNNYLSWLSLHNLDHRKAVEHMTANQKKLDAKILLLSA